MNPAFKVHFDKEFQEYAYRLLPSKESHWQLQLVMISNMLMKTIKMDKKHTICVFFYQVLRKITQ